MRFGMRKVGELLREMLEVAPEWSAILSKVVLEQLPGL